MENNSTQQERPPVSSTTLTWFSMIGGAGLLLILVALGAGVIMPDADSSLVGLGVMAGFGFLALGIGAWFIAVQPQRHFDDINVPKYHGHHHDEHEEHEESHDIVDNG